MEVTRSNFAEQFPLIKDAIEECDYLAIDTELTGLHIKATEHPFDTMDERYVKYRENCSKFLIIQYGISAFKYHPAQKKYTHKDFNFYIFPRQYCRQAPDPKFMCQVSSLHFLDSHGFDFNKVIHEGISYLTPAQEEKIKYFLAAKHKNEQDALQSETVAKTNGQKEPDNPDEHKEFIADILERVDSFLSNEKETTIELEPCNSYFRKLIYVKVQQKYQSGIDMFTRVNADNQRFIAIIKSSNQDQMSRLNLKQETDLDDLDAAVGFRKVMDVVSQSKKLVIGHNMFLDMMHTVNQFYFPLPEQLTEYKQMLLELFPRIIDTKHMASSETLGPFFEKTNLLAVAKQVQGKAFNPLNIEVADGFAGYELDSKKAHEAGFDAFATGFCYTALASKIGSMKSSPVEHLDASSKCLKPFMNRIFIMKHDISSLNLSGPDPEPNRENVFHVSFPQQWKTNDLVELFSPYGNISINWLDDVSALVALKNKDCIINAETNLLKKTNAVYTVRTYAEYNNIILKSDSGKSDHKRSGSTSVRESLSAKRRASGNAEEMDLIPEVDEDEADRADDPVSTSLDSKSSVEPKANSSDGPSSKRRKRVRTKRK